MVAECFEIFVYSDFLSINDLQNLFDEEGTNISE